MSSARPSGNPRVRAGETALLVSAASYGISTTVSVAVLDRIGPVDLVAVELSGAAIALLGVAWARGVLRRRDAGRNFAIGALMPGLAFVLGDLGLSRTSASAGSLLLAAELPLSVLLSMVFLRERVRGWGFGALALGLAGSTVVALGGGGGGHSMATALGNVLVVASVSASAVFLILTRTFNGADGLGASAWQNVGAAVCTSPFVTIGWLRRGSDLPHAGWAGWLLATGVLVSTAVGSVAFNWGISRVPGVRASQVLNLTPVVGVAAAIVFLRESPSPAQYVGGGLVLLAVILLVRTVDEDAPPLRSDAAPSSTTDHREPQAQSQS